MPPAPFGSASVSYEHSIMKLEGMKETAAREEHIVLFLPYRSLAGSHQNQPREDVDAE